MNDEEKAARIIRNPAFQALQDWFGETYEVGTGIFDRHVRPLTYETNHKVYCTRVRKKRDGIQRCRQSDARLIAQCRATRRVCWHVCENGLLDLGVPIEMSGKPVAFFLAGQLRGEFRELSTEKSLRIRTRRSLAQAFKAISISGAEDLEAMDDVARRFGQMLSGLLTTLGQWKPEEPTLTQYLEKAGSAETVDELLGVSVDFFPTIIGSKECSIFRVGEDVDEGMRLILRKTSYTPLKKMEGTGYYEYGEGLTGWVWKHGRSLRVKDLASIAELVSIHPSDPPKWSGKLRDSPRRREFLCVPVFGRAPREVIGVIRTPVKAGGFTVDDEITLAVLGDYLYSLIELCERRERATNVQKALEVALSLQRCASQADVWKMLLSAAMSFFGHDGRAYLINLLNPDGDSFTISHADGDLAPKKLVGRKYFLRGTTTGDVLRKGEPVLIHSVVKAEGEKRYVPAVSRGRSAMAAPIQCNGGRRLGVIGVLADKRYAFNSDDAELVGHLGELAAKACEQVTDRAAVEEGKRLRLLSGILDGLMHDLSPPVAIVDDALRGKFLSGPLPDEPGLSGDCVGSPDAKTCHTLRKELSLLTNFTLMGVYAYQFAPIKSQSGESMGLDESLIQRVREKTTTFAIEPLIRICVGVLEICLRQDDRPEDHPRIVIDCPRGYKVTAFHEGLMVPLYNLIKNAWQYANPCKLPQSEIKISVIRDGKYTVITITDHNSPLSEDIAQDLSEFRSEKLGLSLSSLFTRAHPGRGCAGRGKLGYDRVRGKNVFTLEICG